jgi:uncharacterized protein
MKQSMTGRKEELAILKKALLSDEPEMVAVLGRRRVGKTYLIRHAYADRIDFDLTGIQKGTTRQQLQNFAERLTMYAKPLFPFQRPANWFQAFQMLVTWLESTPKEEKRVIFLDELPWLATRKSDFIKALGYFWNSWASLQNICVVICGSAASWMIANIVRDRGGLHNRITRRVHLSPFTLSETEAFFLSRNVHLERYHILLIYMALGGIPHYLKEVEGGKTAAQNIDYICFSQNALLNDEFSQLYPALFDNPEVHIKIVRTLAQTWQGLSRNDLIDVAQLQNSGNTTRALEELVSSGFLSTYYAFGKKKKDLRYRLTDEYSLFYLKFIEENQGSGQGGWLTISQTQSWKSWSGYAFENLALCHIAQIKKALGISGIYTEASSFYQKGTEQQQGVQIDLLIDRNDHAINLCELKFYNSEIVVTKSMAKDLRIKKSLFQAATQTNKQIFMTLISPFSVLPNEHSIGLLDNSLGMDVFFEG